MGNVIPVYELFLCAKLVKVWHVGHVVMYYGEPSENVIGQFLLGGKEHSVTISIRASERRVTYASVRVRVRPSVRSEIMRAFPSFLPLPSPAAVWDLGSRPRPRRVRQNKETTTLRIDRRDDAAAIVSRACTKSMKASLFTYFLAPSQRGLRL